MSLLQGLKIYVYTKITVIMLEKLCCQWQYDPKKDISAINRNNVPSMYCELLSNNLSTLVQK